jgi:hypothetical protein
VWGLRVVSSKWEVVFLNIMNSNEEREVWMKKDPSVYFITEHYRNYPSLLINLAKVRNSELKILLETAWKSRANKKQLKEYEEGY